MPLKAKGAKSGSAQRISRSGVVAALLVLIMVALIGVAPSILSWQGRAPKQLIAKGSGYDRVVREVFAERGWLTVGTDADGKRIVSLAGPVARNEALLTYVNSSRLRRDMQDASLWRLDDGGAVLELDPYAHKVARPFDRSEGWARPIFFRGGSEIGFQLRRLADRRVIAVSSSGDAARRCDIDINDDNRWPSAGGERRALGICEGGRPLARLSLVGDQLVVRAGDLPSETTVLVGGVRLRADAAQASAVTMQPGEELSVRGPQGSVSLLVDRRVAAIAVGDPSFAREAYPGLETIAGGLDRAMVRSRLSQLRLTLDQDMQDLAQAALVEQASHLQGDGDAFRAAVTVMDGRTGEILALASYPSDPDQLSEDQRGTRGGEALLERNHNLSLMPIGSIAKVPLSIAILDSQPRLAAFRISPGASRTIMGIDIGSEFYDTHSGPPVDFPSYLAISSNRYALGLMLIGLGEQPGPAYACGAFCEDWSLGRSRRDTPRLAILENSETGAFGRIPTMASAMSVPWATSLQTLFDIAPDRAACGYDIQVWRDLANGACNNAFAGVAPQTEALGLNAVSELSSGYLMSVLGGSRSSWTTVKVAEVFSRIVTGRQVRSRLTLTPKDTPAPVPLDYHIDDSEDLAGLRDHWMQGLYAVARPGGTAATLGARFRNAGYPSNVVLYAKTGTPSLESGAVQSPANARLTALIDNRCGVRWDAAAGRLTFGAGPVPSDDELVARMRDHNRQQCVIAAGPGDALKEAVVTQMATFDCPRARRDCIPDGVRMEGGVVTGVQRRLQGGTARGSMFGHAVALSAVRYESGHPARVLTIVINIQRRTRNTPALTVAETILDSDPVRAWMRGGDA
ncbi:hypothetical protein [Brevundimonas sp.]|uniref:hypothetical protein n=1 Tax=Brevundimonas sp. TaxID=1871086 RepID=UPI003D12BAFD